MRIGPHRVSRSFSWKVDEPRQIMGNNHAPNPQELLSRSTFSEILDTTTRHHDVVLIDTPAAGSYADALTVAIRAGGAVMVARKNHSPLPGFRTLARHLQASCTVVGSVLNDNFR